MSFRLYPAIALAVIAGACSRKPSSQEQPPPRPSVAGSPTASNSEGLSAAAAPSAPVSAAPAAPLEHCKAFGKKGPSLLAISNEMQPRLRVEGGTLFVFGYTHELARAALQKVSRAGGKLETIASQKGLGEPEGLALSKGAAYYTQRGSLFKLGPAPGAAVELRKGADSPPAIVDDRVLVVECDKQGPDKLLELPASGGDASVLAELPHTSKERCKYSSIVADASDVFVADWRGSRVVAVSRRDKSLRDVVTKKGFPSELNLDGDDLVLMGALGLLRVPRAGGEVKKLLDAQRFAAPDSSVVVHGAEYWLTDQLAYATTNSLFRMPRDATPPRVVASYHVKDPVGPSEKGDSGLRDFAVDDECVYAVEWRHGQAGHQLIARAK